MMRIPLFAFATAVVLAPLASLAQTRPTGASLTIQASQSAHAISPTLYGLMTEEINYSYDGGLYAELVRNRTFDHDWSGIPRWYLANQGSALATMSYDSKSGPSTALPDSLQLEIKQADANNPAGLRNEGYWGMNIHPNTVYKGSFYAKADSAAFGSLKFSLVNNTTGATVAVTTAPALSEQWTRYEYTLQTAHAEASSNYHLLITAAHPGKLWLQLVSLFPPTYQQQSNGFRPDLMEMMAAMHPKFLRLPGGNYLEGNKLDERFDWKKTIGPLVDRPTHRSPWGYQSTDGLGLMEFMQWCEDLHIEPVLAVFAGYTLDHDYVKPGSALQPYVDDALDELEFLTGDVSTRWGATRARLGHPAPFVFHYVEIGNEDEFDKSGSYEDRYRQFYKAIKAKYPQLQLIATTPLKNFRPDVIDDHYYKRADGFFDFDQHYDAADRKGPKIFVGEWATREGAPTTDMGAALGDAAWMTSMERNSDLIVMASYAPMLVNVNPGGMQWESNLIGYDAAKAYGSPSYYAQCLFGRFIGDEYLAATATSAGSRFFYSVTRNTKSSEIYIKLVNASSASLPLNLDLRGADIPSQNATVFTLRGTNTAETNSIDSPTRIIPVQTTLKVGKNFAHTMPPFAVQVIVLHVR